MIAILPAVAAMVRTGALKRGSRKFGSAPWASSFRTSAVSSARTALARGMPRSVLRDTVAWLIPVITGCGLAGTDERPFLVAQFVVQARNITMANINTVQLGKTGTDTNFLLLEIGCLSQRFAALTEQYCG